MLYLKCPCQCQYDWFSNCAQPENWRMNLLLPPSLPLPLIPPPPHQVAACRALPPHRSTMSSDTRLSFRLWRSRSDVAGCSASSTPISTMLLPSRRRLLTATQLGIGNHLSTVLQVEHLSRLLERKLQRKGAVEHSHSDAAVSFCVPCVRVKS